MNRKKLKNNTNLAVNISALQGFLPNSKVLVLKEYMADIDGDMNGFKINDYFDAVIAETPEAAASVQNPDFIVYSDASPYRNNVLYIEKLAQYQTSIICTNYEAVKIFKKLGRSLGTYNINYLVGEPGPAKNPSEVRRVKCGLCSEGPGVHLALLMGASNIYYTGTKKVTYEALVHHVEKKDGAVPVNIVRPNRRPVLHAKL